jgi:hypothetical protein
MMSATLQFKSGFEEGSLIVPFSWKAGRHMHRISGIDTTTGCDWDGDLPCAHSYFVYLIGDHLPDEHVTSDIVTVAGRDGSTTQALHMSVTADYAPAKSTTRNEWSMFYDEGDHRYEEGYVKYWMKLEDDFVERFPKEQPNWRMMMEWKEPSSGTTTEKGGTNNYRINIHIVMRDGVPRWQVIGQEVQPVRITEWEEVNADHVVPADRWFLVEAYMKKHATDGRVWFAVDGETICDYRGRTEHKDNPLPLKFWSIFKLYHGTKWLEAGPTHQWIDDVELWSGMPDARSSDK